MYLAEPDRQRIDVAVADVMPSPADREQLIAGLAAPSPSIASRFLYDALGSRLFAAITALDEYYLTRTEAAIVDAHLQDIADALGQGGWNLVDIGAGDCAKAARLFTVLRPARYVAIDISAVHLRESLDRLRPRFPQIAMSALAADFTRGLTLPKEIGFARRLLHFPGSSIGNFTPVEAQALLARLRTVVDVTGGLLIGFDLVKDPGILNAAYDDALGVTAAFNLNVLRNVNRIARTDFAPRDWRHVARFDEAHSRIEMDVEARRPVDVRWKDGGRSFRVGDRVRTEYSYKYTLGGIGQLLAAGGFAIHEAWTDDRGWYAYVCARPCAASA